MLLYHVKEKQLLFVAKLHAVICDLLGDSVRIQIYGITKQRINSYSQRIRDFYECFNAHISSVFN